MVTPADRSIAEEVSITTEPEFIRLLGKRLYSNNTVVILARELAQNSRDATLDNHGKINIEFERTGASVRILCNDTGIGMDEDTLKNVFLRLGKSKKTSAQAVGRFGAAKAAIFCTRKWFCRTRDNIVKSEEDKILFSKLSTSHKPRGTEVEAHVDMQSMDQAEAAINYAKLFLFSCRINNLWVEGKKVLSYKPRKFYAAGYYMGQRYEVSIARPVLNYKNCLIWRIRGLTQFVERISTGDDYGINIVIDFDKLDYRPDSDTYPFSMSRENVQESIRQEVLAMIRPLVKNARTTKARFAKEKVQRDHVRHYSNTGNIVVNAPKRIPLVHWQIMRLWQSIIEACGYDEAAKFGLTYDENFLAVRQGDGTYLINASKVAEEIYEKEDSLALVMRLWHIAVHELTHKTYSDHDEDFTSQEGKLAYVTIGQVSAKLGSLRADARKVLRVIGQ